MQLTTPIPACEFDISMRAKLKLLQPLVVLAFWLND